MRLHFRESFFFDGRVKPNDIEILRNYCGVDARSYFMRCFELGAGHEIVILEYCFVAKILGSEIDYWVISIISIKNKPLLHLLILLFSTGIFLIGFR